MQVYRLHGMKPKYYHRVVGWIVRRVVEQGLPLRGIGSDLIDEAAQATLGHSLACLPTSSPGQSTRPPSSPAGPERAGPPVDPRSR